ncbi:MAG: hypothetical protein Q8K58_05365 [Acidimicrobiales bacterium]|nr:hypothetical protein [Acidimicrobiales bacterium]
MTDGPTPPPGDDYAPTSLPSTGARVLAFLAILIGGLCGGLIGYGFTDLQCTDGCTGLAGGVGLAGATVGAVGVGVVSILALRAMGEWRTIQRRDDERP